MFPRLITLPRAAFGVVFLLSGLGLAFGQPADVRVYVQFAPGQKAAGRAAVAQARAQEHHVFDDLDAVAVTLPEAARAALLRNPAIALIEEDPKRGFLATTQVRPYGITMVQAPEAVAAGATGEGIKVGVIDSGVFRNHQDLAAVTITGQPYFGAGDARNWDRDYNSHGTHVVGTIAAADNDVGVEGVSRGKVSIHMVKVFGDAGNWIYSSDLLSAARSAAGAGARIISMSLGGGRSSGIENRGMADLYKQGILLVAAAGNDGNTATSYPAGYASVISVAAIDSAQTVASFSQQNSSVELSAPGVGVLSTVSYLENNGVTVGSDSFAATHIEFSARTTSSVSGGLVYGGLGTATNSAWSGKVVLLDRGENSFYEKVRNVQLSGGVACIIANNVEGAFAGTLGDGNTSTIPGLGVSQADGTLLKARAGQTAAVTAMIANNQSAYEEFDGTSMATPHVAGVAALLWSAFPTITNETLRQTLTSTAKDLGTAGRDNAYGYGLVQAKAALDALAAVNPPGNPSGSDLTPPVISNVAAVVTNAKNGSFQITWTTDEASTSDVNLINVGSYPDATLTTTHKRTFRGTKGATYVFTVSSADAAGNRSTSTESSIILK